MTGDEKVERGRERAAWIMAALRESGLDALFCTIPENLLLLSGYWPVVGTATAVVTVDGRVAVLAPEDEADLAHGGWADQVSTYSPGSLTALTGPTDVVVEPLGSLLRDLGVSEGTIGVEDRSIYEGSTYAAMFLFQIDASGVLSRAVPKGRQVSAAPVLWRLRARLTTYEVGRVRQACHVAGDAFTASSERIQPGVREPEVAAAVSREIEVRGMRLEGVARSSAFAWCMSGENSALAGAAYARTRNRELRQGDLVLVHCNSTIDGYWTDITRTYSLGEPSGEASAMYDAIFAARRAALGAIRPGARAADVDRAARSVLEERGFGRYFTHGVGHNVGFSVISAEFPPRLHPASPDILETGMTFNIEPSIYIHGFGGIRHCDVVTLREDGPEVLTPFQGDPAQLTISRT